MKTTRERRPTVLLFGVTVLLLLTAGCGKVNDPQATLLTDIAQLTVEETVQIVGLGEASHGTSQFQQLKGQVFQALVANNGCRIFAIEGDFGGCAKVNAYIHGDSQTAQEAVSQIGFRIYQTEEMADIIEWMRTYNETAPPGQDLKFYGFDAQRYDHNKELLFSYLSDKMPALMQAYVDKFTALTDADMYDLPEETLAQAEQDLLALMAEMIGAKPANMTTEGQLAYDTAYQCAQSLLDNTRLRTAGMGYNTLRDDIMAQKVQWIQQHEAGLIFINGHNGHIAKTSSAGYSTMGQHLVQAYGQGYFSIGTDALTTVFNANTGADYESFTISNSNAFTQPLEELEANVYYLDFAQAAQDKYWQETIHKPQVMTALNVEFSTLQQAIKRFSTITVTPSEAYDGVIIFNNTSATKLL